MSNLLIDNFDNQSLTILDLWALETNLLLLMLCEQIFHRISLLRKFRNYSAYLPCKHHIMLNTLATSKGQEYTQDQLHSHSKSLLNGMERGVVLGMKSSWAK